MFNMITNKIKNKLWLTICLVLGMSFLVAAFSCQPMFKSGSLDMLLITSFENYIEENNQYPVTLGRNGVYNSKDYDSIDVGESSIDNYISVWSEYLSGIDILANQTVYEFEEESSQGSYGSKGNYLNISYIPDLLEHVELVKGVDYYEYAGKEGYYPCIISEGVMDESELIAEETLEFINWTDGKGNTVKLVICGIFKESSSSDLFWYVEPNELEEHVFVSKENFDVLMAQYDDRKVNYRHYTMLDYLDIKSDNVDDVVYYLDEFAKADGNFFETFKGILEEYMSERKTVNVILWVLELPILGMVLAFIYMVSKQIVETEKNEIAMLKSRGFSRTHVVAMYGGQAGILAILSVLVGVPLGYLLCKVAAGTTDFLTFSFGNTGVYDFTASMILYGILAGIIGIVFILVPVVLSTKVSIVERKSGNSESKKPFWEKYFFDFILLGVAIYLLYNFNQDKENIRSNALAGSKMDPMIFLNSVIFIIALGLVTLRIIHILVKLVYRIGKKRWKPAMYASFLQITRTTAKQGFISVFLILTVSLGLFNANTARTINRNNEERIEYEVGADIVLHEQWTRNLFYLEIPERHIVYTYDEPDYNKYEELEKEGICDSVARVIYDNNTLVTKGGTKVENCMLMGINTKEFGETTDLKDEISGGKHWYNYLNAMATESNGVIISSNLATKLGVKEGDIIRLTRYSVLKGQSDQVKGGMAGEVCAIVDSWPGFDRYYYDEEGELKENYLVVAHYANVVNSFDLSPYEVWIKLSEGKTWEDVQEFLNKYNVQLEYKELLEESVSDMKASPMIQITNGMFTLSFIIALILCAVGFLIYWISSIRQRELLFGVYRAMGMSVENVNKMLINEHIFSTFLSVLSGGVVGMVSTLFFVELFGLVYLPEKHNLDIYIYFEISDVIKLAIVVLLMILVCILVLRKLVRSLNITQALKLGEE